MPETIRPYAQHAAAPPADGDLDLRELVAVADRSDAAGGTQFPTHDQLRRLYTGDVQRADVADVAAFKALPTVAVDLAPGAVRLVVLAGEERRYVFTEDAAGDIAQSLPEIVLPDDYHATTNPYYWRLARAPVPSAAKWHYDAAAGRFYGYVAATERWHEVELDSDPGDPSITAVVDAGLTPMTAAEFADHLATP